MKKTAIVGLALALMAITPMCVSAREGQTFTTSYYTMSTPDGWSVNNQTRGEDDLGYLYGPGGVNVEAGAKDVTDGYVDFDIANASNGQLNDYLTALKASFENDDPIFVDTIKAGNLSFVVLSVLDEGGAYYYAETRDSGKAMYFKGYTQDAGGTMSATQDVLSAMKSLLSHYDSGQGGLSATSPRAAELKEATWDFINMVSDSSMSNYDRFSACYSYLLAFQNFYIRSDDYYDLEEPDWAYKFAIDCFENDLTGDCFAFACCMGSVGTELGFDCTVNIAIEDHAFVEVDGHYVDNMDGYFYSDSDHSNYHVIAQWHF